MNITAKAVRKFIDQLGVTQAEAARLMGLAPRTMRKYCEKGAPLIVKLAFQQLISERK